MGETLELRVGTCGWSYEDWKGVFYPSGCDDELVFYAGRFGCVEIDSTWYRIPARRTVESWARRAPEGFLFCPKMTGEITHDNLLVGTEELVARFIDHISLLGDKLGPILVQLAPKFRADQLPLLREFLDALPSQLRFAVEFRHRSWVDEPEALVLLRDLNMALVMAEHPWYPLIEEVTCDIAYVRLLGLHKGLPDMAHLHRPRDESLGRWAGVLNRLGGEVRQAFVLVNNHYEGYSVRSVERLVALLDEPPTGAHSERQERLEL